jgi:hypothetical protein
MHNTIYIGNLGDVMAPMGPQVDPPLSVVQCRDAPLYLEWAPSNVLNQKSTSKGNEMNSRIGEKDVKRQILEQDVERISDIGYGY